MMQSVNQLWMDNPQPCARFFHNILFWHFTKKGESLPLGDLHFCWQSDSFFGWVVLTTLWESSGLNCKIQQVQAKQVQVEALELEGSYLNIFRIFNKLHLKKIITIWSKVLICEPILDMKMENPKVSYRNRFLKARGQKVDGFQCYIKRTYL